MSPPTPGRRAAPRGQDILLDPRLRGDAKSSERLRLVAIAVAAAFVAYFSMYGFRKPFVAAAWDSHAPWMGVSFKLALVLAQVFGYTISKFVGIQVVTGWDRRARGALLIGLIAWAEVSLILFALVPPSARPLCMFLNGLPLGMVWGLVFSYLEGRRTSDLLGAGLSMSYIVASGAVRSVGALLLARGVDPEWMPAAVGGLFILPFALAVWVLERLPAPDTDDERERTHRAPMDRADRWGFFGAFAPGLIALTALYLVLTAFRDVRDNFQTEIMRAAGIADPGAFAWMELVVAALVLAALAAVVTIRDNRRAVLVMHAAMLAGSLLIGAATLAYAGGLIGPRVWMVATGVGTYVAYVPFGCTLFDRLLAAVGWSGTAVFMIYVTDAFGYLGVVCLLLFRNFGATDVSWLDFFQRLSVGTSILCMIGLAASWRYFAVRTLDGRAARPPGTP